MYFGLKDSLYRSGVYSFFLFFLSPPLLPAKKTIEQKNPLLPVSVVKLAFLICHSI